MLLVWAYYVDWRIVTPLVIRTPAGERTFMVHGNPDSYSRQLDWVQAINFPAGWAVLPAELAATKGEGGGFAHPLWRHWRFVGFAVAGVFVWILAGRYVDSAVAMVRKREAILPKAADWVFAICTAVSGFLEIAVAHQHRVYLAWGTVWVLLGCSALLLYIFQAWSIRKIESEPSPGS
jgi:hypothetical protein